MKNLSDFRLTFSLLALSVAPLAQAAENFGRALIVKGIASQTVGNRTLTLKEGDAILQGAVVTTGPQSAVKLMLQDQSTLSLGSDSTVKMEELANNRLRSVNLLQGQLRSHIIKDVYGASGGANGVPSPASLQTAPKVKFLFKTKTAVMGVRGTELQIVYNRENQVTSLVTFDGAVAMIKSDLNTPASALLPQNLAPLLSSEKAMLVTEGRFSTVNPSMVEATIPTKLSPAQFESMKKVEPTSAIGAGSKEGSTKTTAFISPIPPGIDAKSFAAGGPSSAALSNMGISDAVTRDIASSKASANVPGPFNAPAAPPPEGSYNSRTGSYAPPAGGFLDIKTGLYIPPPPGSIFDPNNGVYVPPPSVGKFDSGTGAYVPPTDLKLDARQGFVPATEAPKSNNGSPASSGSPGNSGKTGAGSGETKTQSDAKETAKTPAVVGAPDSGDKKASGTANSKEFRPVTIDSTKSAVAPNNKARPAHSTASSGTGGAGGKNSASAPAGDPTKPNLAANTASYPVLPAVQAPPPAVFIPPPVGSPTYYGTPVATTTTPTNTDPACPSCAPPPTTITPAASGSVTHVHFSFIVR